jgi:hypothetical protein
MCNLHPAVDTQPPALAVAIDLGTEALSRLLLLLLLLLHANL